MLDRIFARIRDYDGTVCEDENTTCIMLLTIQWQATKDRPIYPVSIAGLKVTSVCDLTIGYDTTNPPSYKPSLPLSSGHMIQFRAQSENGTKIVLTTR